MSKGRGWGREEGKREGDKRVWRGREGEAGEEIERDSGSGI